MSMTRSRAPIGILVEQRHPQKSIAPEIEVRDPRRTGVFMIRGTAVWPIPGRRLPARNDDLLVRRCRPLEIGDSDLAVRAVLQAAETPWKQGPGITLALDGESSRSIE